MFKVFPALAAALFLALMGLTGCDDNKPENRASTEKVPPIPSPAPIVMGYGRDWSTQDCESFTGIDLPSGIRICGIIGNGQGSPLEISLNRRDAFKRARLATVEVNSPDAPVVLLLSNYHSTLWQIKSTPGTEVLAAAASGYEPQAVMGLKPDVMTMINDSNGYQRCGQFYQKPGQRQALANFSKKSLGRAPDMITEMDENKAVCGWPASPGQELISHGETRPEKYDAYAGLLDQLNEAEKTGLIRRAMPADLREFKKVRSIEGRLLIEERGPEILRDSYVIASQDFAFPDDLYRPGDLSPHRIFTFFIPQGFNLPEGPIQGARILFLKDGACLGWNCGHNQGVYNTSRASLKFSAPDLKLPPECRFDDLKLPEGTKIYAGGAYKGRQIGIKDPKSKHDLGRMDVTVKSPENPVALILSAYDPVEWHLDIKPGTEVAAVVLSGYHTQRLMNLPKDIPVVSGSYDGRRCWGFYFSRDNFVRINHISENLFGRVPDRGFKAAGGKLTIDSSLPLRETPPEGLTPPLRPTNNQQLKEALAQGLIKPATNDIKKAWFKKNSERIGVINLMEPADFHLLYATSFPAYEIISDQFTFPEKTSGADRADFYLPENLYMPEGDPGQSTIYLMENGSCLGSMPGCSHYRY